jgi:hypothetical protein
MHTLSEERRVDLEMLTKWGARWAVLAAMSLDLSRRGIRIPPEIDADLKLARVEIQSGCFSPCEVGCALAKIEGRLAPLSFAVGQQYWLDWSALLAQAMRGQIALARVSEIPALKPIASDCAFRACSCS